MSKRSNFSDCKHFTSELSVVESTAASNTVTVLDNVDSQKNILDTKYIEPVSGSEFVSQRSSDQIMKHEKASGFKGYQAKSLDTLLYKVSTSATLSKKHTTTKDTTVVIQKPVLPKYMIKEMPYNTINRSIDPLPLTKKIVIIKKVRKRIVSKRKTNATNETSGSEISISEGDHQFDIDKYRLSTEPYLGEDFVPLDLTRKITYDEEENNNKRLLKIGELKDDHIKFDLEDKVGATNGKFLNKDGNKENMYELEDSYGSTSLREDFDVNDDQDKGSATKRRDKLSEGTDEQYKLGRIKQITKKGVDQLAEEFESNADNLDVNPLGQEFNTDSELYKSSRSTKISSEAMDKSDKEFDGDAKLDKFGIDTKLLSEDSSTLKKEFDAANNQNQLDETAQKTSNILNPLNEGSNVGADQRVSKGSKSKDSNKGKQDKSTDRYQLDKESETANNVLGSGTRARKTELSSKNSSQDALRKLRQRRLSSDPNTDKYSVKTGRTQGK